MESLQIISQWKINDMDQTEHKMLEIQQQCEFCKSHEQVSKFWLSIYNVI